MNRKDFEKKYGLRNIDPNSFKFATESNASKSIELVGKPKKIPIEILKRFFSNPYSIIALVVFLFVFLMAIIVPFVSPFKDNAPITNQLVILNGSLPPSSAPVVTRIFSNSNRDLLLNIQANLNEGGVPFILSMKQLGFNQWQITYNAYQLLSITNNGAQFSSILGTTNNGFDIWTRSWGATIQSLLLAILVSTINTIIGVSLGVYLGFHLGKPIDTFFSRILDIVNGLPTLIWVLILVSILGTNFWQLVFVMVIIGWTGPVAEARFFAITVKDEDFVTAAEAVGASKYRRIFIHVLPAIAGKLGISFVQNIPNVILTVSALAFLGFLTNPTNANLGTVLNQAIGDFSNNPWSLVFPALILLSLTLSLQFIAIGVHDALDPKLRKAIK